MDDFSKLTDAQLALGTAHFGQPYGIVDSGIRIGFREIESIVNKAYTFGVKTLDTAIAYGDCENILGEIGVQRWRVITKLSALPRGEEKR